MGSPDLAYPLKPGYDGKLKVIDSLPQTIRASGLISVAPWSLRVPKSPCKQPCGFLVALLAAFLAAYASSPASAWDPFGLGNVGRGAAKELRGAVSEAIAGLRELQKSFGVDVSRHIAELDSLTQSAIRSTDRFAEARINQSFDRVDKIVALAVSEVNQLVQCAPPILANELEATLAKTKLLGFSVIRQPSNKPRDNTPFEQYRSTRDDLQAALKDATPETPAENVQAIYSELARLAQRTQCFYRGLDTGSTLIRYHFVPNARRAAAWSTVFE